MPVLFGVSDGAMLERAEYSLPIIFSRSLFRFDCHSLLNSRSVQRRCSPHIGYAYIRRHKERDFLTFRSGPRLEGPHVNLQREEG